MNKVLILTASALIATGGFALAQDKVIVEVPQPARDYVIAHPSDPVVIDGELGEGYVVPQSVAVRSIPESPGYGYIYVDGRPVIVSLENRQVVYLSESRDGPVPEDVITYVEQNPVDAVAIDEVTPGAVVSDDYRSGSGAFAAALRLYLCGRRSGAGRYADAPGHLGALEQR
jgi:hypothetical protein